MCLVISCHTSCDTQHGCLCVCVSQELEVNKVLDGINKDDKEQQQKVGVPVCVRVCVPVCLCVCVCVSVSVSFKDYGKP